MGENAWNQVEAGHRKAEAEAAAIAEFQREFGRTIEHERSRHGWTAEEAARRAGMAPKTWQRLENGRPVRNETYAKLDELFGLPAGTSLRCWIDRESLQEQLDHLRERRTPTRDHAERESSGDAAQEARRLRAILRDVYQAIHPFMEVLDATQNALENIRVDAIVLSRLAEHTDLPPLIRESITALDRNVHNYSSLVMDKATWKTLSHEMIRLADEVDKSGGFDGEH